MTVWILHQQLSEADEAQITGRQELTLPFAGYPDLSAIHTASECRAMVQRLDPDAAPETVTRRSERLWYLFTSIEQEDIIAVPLAITAQVALAKVSGRYRYRVGEHGEDKHLLPVEWYLCVPLRSFGKHQQLFWRGSEDMIEVDNQPGRIAIREKLPHSYNRFAGLKWLIIVLVAMRVVAYVLQMLSKHQ